MMNSNRVEEKILKSFDNVNVDNTLDLDELIDELEDTMEIDIDG